MAALSVTGFGIGLIVTAITSALLGSVDKSRSGIAAGTLPAFRQTGIWWCAVAVPWLIAVWALGGLYLSLGPSLAAQVPGSPSRLWGGLVIFPLTAGLLRRAVVLAMR